MFSILLNNQIHARDRNRSNSNSYESISSIKGNYNQINRELIIDSNEKEITIPLNIKVLSIKLDNQTELPKILKYTSQSKNIGNVEELNILVDSSGHGNNIANIIESIGKCNKQSPMSINIINTGPAFSQTDQLNISLVIQKNQAIIKSLSIKQASTSIYDQIISENKPSPVYPSYNSSTSNPYQRVNSSRARETKAAIFANSLEEAERSTKRVRHLNPEMDSVCVAIDSGKATNQQKLFGMQPSQDHSRDLIWKRYKIAKAIPMFRLHRDLSPKFYDMITKNNIFYRDAVDYIAESAIENLIYWVGIVDEGLLNRLRSLAKDILKGRQADRNIFMLNGSPGNGKTMLWKNAGYILFTIQMIYFHFDKKLRNCNTDYQKMVDYLIDNYKKLYNKEKNVLKRESINVQIRNLKNGSVSEDVVKNIYVLHTLAKRIKKVVIDHGHECLLDYATTTGKLPYVRVLSGAIATDANSNKGSSALYQGAGAGLFAETIYNSTDWQVWRNFVKKRIEKKDDRSESFKMIEEMLSDSLFMPLMPFFLYDEADKVSKSQRRADPGTELLEFSPDSAGVPNKFMTTELPFSKGYVFATVNSMENIIQAAKDRSFMFTKNNYSIPARATLFKQTLSHFLRAYRIYDQVIIDNDVIKRLSHPQAGGDATSVRTLIEHLKSLLNSILSSLEYEKKDHKIHINMKNVEDFIPNLIHSEKKGNTSTNLNRTTLLSPIMLADGTLDLAEIASVERRNRASGHYSIYSLVKIKGQQSHDINGRLYTTIDAIVEGSLKRSERMREEGEKRKNSEMYGKDAIDSAMDQISINISGNGYVNQCYLRNHASAEVHENTPGYLSLVFLIVMLFNSMKTSLPQDTLILGDVNIHGDLKSIGLSERNLSNYITLFQDGIASYDDKKINLVLPLDLKSIDTKIKKDLKMFNVNIYYVRNIHSLCSLLKLLSDMSGNNGQKNKPSSNKAQKILSLYL